VEALLVDGSAVATATSYTFYNVQGTHQITATFAPSVGGTDVPEEIGDLTIRGRFVHAFTGVPLSGVAVRGAVPPSTILSTLTTSNANGEFSITTDTRTVVAGGAVRGFSGKLSCYFSTLYDSLATVKRYSDGRLAILHNPFDLIRHGTKNVDPVTTSIVDLGNVPLWPAKTIMLTSDVPVKFSIVYSEEAHSTGNTLLKTQHTVTDIVALDYNVVVTATDGNGTVYTSPIKRYAADADCTPAALRLSGGVLTWQ
jgi:hypothetical protein